MRIIIALSGICFVLFAVAGCQNAGSARSHNELFAVDFKPGTTLTYKLVSERNMLVDFDSKGAEAGRESQPQKHHEKLTLVIDYTPIQIDELFGLTTVEAKCKSAKVIRQKAVAGSDAIESLAGRTFKFNISSTGKITDYSDIQKTVKEIGRGAFQSVSGGGRLKNPDMIFDFIALQEYLWGAIASIENPLDGVSTGQSWESTQIVPLPIPFPTFRNTKYTFSEIMPSESGNKAVITSSFSLSDTQLDNWPRPFEGKFRMKGTFGFLRNYQYLSLEGEGREIFDIETGIMRSLQQKYRMEMSADFMLPLGDSEPGIVIDQKMSIQLVD